MAVVIIGVDPGLKGALVCLDLKDGLLLDYTPMLEAHLLADWLERQGEDLKQGRPHIFIEKAQSMPGNRAQSMFNYGTGFGILLGIIATLKYSYTLVPPSAWTKVMHQGVTATLDPKVKSLTACRRLFPHVDLPCGPRSKKPHDGIVDALLIGEYGRRTLMQRP